MENISEKDMLNQNPTSVNMNYSLLPPTKTFFEIGRVFLLFHCSWVSFNSGVTGRHGWGGGAIRGSNFNVNMIHQL